ncbi:hypothetical protein FQR65_LT13509 [Abscondita terminalis]|nr:hypothetical protein FQR65_LT13509 [Abscondita terminalis]
MMVVQKALVMMSLSILSCAYIPYNQKPEMCIDLSLYTLRCLDNNLHHLNATLVERGCNELSDLFGFHCVIPRDVRSVSSQIQCLILLSESINVWKQMVTVHYLNKLLQEHPKTKECMCNYFSYLSKCRI